MVGITRPVVWLRLKAASRFESLDFRAYAICGFVRFNHELLRFENENFRAGGSRGQRDRRRHTLEPRLHRARDACPRISLFSNPRMRAIEKNIPGGARRKEVETEPGDAAPRDKPSSVREMVAFGTKSPSEADDDRFLFQFLCKTFT